MKTYNTVAIETDINGVGNNDELTALFARALELCQTAKSSQVMNCSSSSSAQYLSFPDVSYCVQHAESVDLKPIPLPEVPEVDVNDCLNSMRALCTQIKQEITDEREEAVKTHRDVALEDEEVTNVNIAHDEHNEPMMNHQNFHNTYTSQERFKTHLGNHSKEAHLFINSVGNDNQRISVVAQMTELNSGSVNSVGDQDIAEQVITQQEKDTSQNRTKKDIGKKRYICTYCNKACRSNSALEIHVLSHTQKRLFQCQRCGKEVTTAAILKVHMRRHLGDKPFKCSLCDRAFVTKQELKEHLTMHTGEKPYKCQLCEMAFTRSDKLTHHLRTHTGERPHKCEYCNVAFVSKGNLNKHLQKHSKEKPHKCEHCGKGFMMRHDLRRHLLIHSGEKPHKCEICSKAFVRRDKLRQHLRVHWKKTKGHSLHTP